MRGLFLTFWRERIRPWFGRMTKSTATRGIASLWVSLFALGVGLLAVGFAWVADYSAEWQLEFFDTHPEYALLLPPIVFPTVLWLVNRWLLGAGGGGIPQTIQAIRHPKPRWVGQLLGIKALLGKFILTPIVLGSGAAMGREGPTVQLGAALMAQAHRIPAVAKRFDMRSLIIAGGAAGVAAAFNTPLGGLMFAFEELGRRKWMRHTSSLLMAIVIAGLVTLVLQGNYAYFGFSTATIDWAEHWLIIVGLAITTGIIGGVYGRLMLMLVSPNFAVGRLRNKHPYAFAFACGVLLSGMAYVLGSDVFGAGYEVTKTALQDEEHLNPFYWLIKLVASLVSFASGVPGGVFAPTLTIGAGFGNAFAQWCGLEPGALMLLAMVGVLSAVTHCPITSFVIVLEMVDNHELVMPLIFTAAMAAQVSKNILPTSIYHLLANQIRLRP